MVVFLHPSDKTLNFKKIFIKNVKCKPTKIFHIFPLHLKAFSCLFSSKKATTKWHKLKLTIKGYKNSGTSICFHI